MDKKKNEKKEKKSLSLLDYILLICLNIAITCAILALYTKFFIPKIAVVDFDSYLLGLRNLYISGKIDDTMMKKYIDEAVMAIKKDGEGYTVFLGGNVILRGKNVKQIALPQLPQEAYNLNMTPLFTNPFSMEGSPFQSMR